MSSLLRLRPEYRCVLDVLHHRVYAGPDADDALPDLMRHPAGTWDSARDGVPKIHYSTQATGLAPVRTPSTSIRPSSRVFLDLAPGDVEFDCMLEAKAKDLALFRVRDALGIAA